MLWLLISMQVFLAFISIQWHQGSAPCLPMSHLKWRLLEFALPTSMKSWTIITTLKIEFLATELLYCFKNCLHIILLQSLGVLLVCYSISGLGILLLKKALSLEIPYVCHLFLIHWPWGIANDVLVICVRELVFFSRVSLFHLFQAFSRKLLMCKTNCFCSKAIYDGLRGLQGMMHRLLWILTFAGIRKFAKLAI